MSYNITVSGDIMQYHSGQEASVKITDAGVMIDDEGFMRQSRAAQVKIVFRLMGKSIVGSGKKRLSILCNN